MFCIQCGSQYEGGATFCRYCGVRLSEHEDQGQGEKPTRSWFHNHLNWTLVLAEVAITGLVVILIGAAGSLLSDSEAALAYLLTVILQCALRAVVGGWVLKQKSRSLWWVLLAVTWVGPVVWLALENNRAIRPPDGISATLKEGNR